MRAVRMAIGSLLALAVTVAVSSGQQKVDVSTRAVIAAATKYVVDYEAKFKFVIADETYAQATFDNERRETGRRSIKGELFLTFIPADAAWLAVHDFTEVDGQPVADREDLRALLQKGETNSVVRSVLTRNSRFNLGSIVRNFNEPTLALLILEPKRVRGFAFDRQEILQSAGRTKVRLSFRERDRPTLVRDANGRPVYARGELTIDAESGRVEHTVIELVDGPILARLTTTYAFDEKVEMWVPVAFAERYERTKGDREVILCDADYTNYRRFEVTARIK
ncbi:MAG TPA: hypothetical protein VES67_23000 [Vicinamibacterales bacterium]|nr:hypothetical protein [Vicinamibacterales bacterium]